MKQEVTNFARFYASFNLLLVHLAVGLGLFLGRLLGFRLLEGLELGLLLCRHDDSLSVFFVHD